MSIIWILFLPFVGSVCAVCLPSNARNAEAWLAGLVGLVCVGLTISLWPQIADGQVLRATIPWAPALGLNVTLRMDGYAWLFALLITVMGTLVALYARYYMSPRDPVPRFFSFFLAFMGAMLGIVLSGNLIQMVLFWELTSLTSFLLIAYWHHRIDARRGARMALIVTSGGGLCLLAGVLLLGRIVGSYDLDAVLASGDLIRAHPWYHAVLLLIALGALTKSAQFPFQFWLPHAMAAPTPVSAYLHSATMVKAGVFLLVRLWPVLSGTEEWLWLIGGAGVCSLLLGAYAATFQRDMKGVLAYSTISHLGLITLLLGLNSQLALVAAIFHIINHATFKASLFMAAGVVDHETGTRDLTRLSGLYRAMPITALLAIVAAASMAGVPLLNGFISKEMFFTETVFISGSPIMRAGLPAVAVVYGVFSVAYSLRFILQVFFGPPALDLPRQPHEPVGWMLVPSALLVLICLVVGTMPALTIGPLLAAAAHSVLGADMPSYNLMLWHGWNLPLMMSLLALAGGMLLYLMLGKYQHRAPGVVPLIEPVNGKRLFDFVLDNATRAASNLARVTAPEHLQTQLLLIVGAAFGAGLLPLWQYGRPLPDLVTTPVDPVFALLWLIGGGCALVAARQAKYHRLAALMLVGAVGLMTSITFAWFSAPDLALTQLAVESVTLVLILLGLRWLPPRLRADDTRLIPLHLRVRARSRRLRDLLLAIIAGTGFAMLAYMVLTHRAGRGLGSFFVDNAQMLAGGANVVNVILVDFRGFDTFGEITVLAIVALTVYALLRRFRPALESIGRPGQQHDQPAADGGPGAPSGVMVIPAILVRLLAPLALLVSVFFLLRGHDAPGGGFVGGLVLAIAAILQYMVGGTVWAESRTRIHPQYWIGAGLLCAAGAGLLALQLGQPFLSALRWRAMLPLLGEVQLSSVLLFDLGVYLLVIGATVLILVALAHQSLRSHRQQLAAHGVVAPVAIAPAVRTAEV